MKLAIFREISPFRTNIGIRIAYNSLMKWFFRSAWIWMGLGLPFGLFGQVIYLQDRVIDPDASATASLLQTSSSAWNLSREQRLIVQAEEGRLEEVAEALRNRGVRILAWVPENALHVTVPAGTDLSGMSHVRWIGSLLVSDKLSKHLQEEPGSFHVLVEFQPDVSATTQKDLLEKYAGNHTPHPDVPPYMALVEVTQDQVRMLAGLSEVAFIQPAAKPLLLGERMHYCAGVATPYGKVAPFVAVGPGWDGSGLNAVNLTYYFVSYTSDLTVNQQRNEIIRALQEWSTYAQINWTETFSPGQSRSVEIGFYAQSLSSSYPFDGPSGVLAQNYFPSPPNPEPIAGDMYFDDEETWRIGADTDLFSVALHEAGHGLGLNHSGDTSAVMYAFYQIVSGLQADDIAGIRSLYASTGGGPPGGNVDSFEPDNSPPGNLIVSGVSQNKSISPVGDEDWNTFTIPSQGANVVIQTSGASGDTRLYLYRAQGGNNTLVEFDDDDGAGLFSRIERSLSGGTYRIQVDEFGDNNVISSYSLRVDISFAGGGDSFEPDNSNDTATTAVPGTPQFHSILPVGDVDFTTFTLTSVSDVTIQTSGASGDTELWLYGSDRSVLEYNDDGGGGLFSRIDRTQADLDPLPPGTYFVSVGEKGNDATIASYQLNISVTPQGSDDAYEENDTLGTAYDPGFDWDDVRLSNIQGLGVAADAADFYRITVGPAGETNLSVRLLFSHQQGDLDLQVLSSTGQVLGRSQSTTDNESIRLALPSAGVYYLEVYPYRNPTSQGYDLIWEDLTDQEAKANVTWNDMDGDGATDVVAYDSLTGQWDINLSSGGRSRSFRWGDSSMVRVDGDYNADGKFDLALYQPATGQWFIRQAEESGGLITFGQRWGDGSMIPVSGDYNGDGAYDLALYQPSTGLWYIRPLGPNRRPIAFGRQWGGPTMIPVPGDYNADGIADLAVFEPSTGTWYIKPVSAASPPIAFGLNWGTPAMVPAPGDYNGDGRDDLAMYEPGTGNWYIRSLGSPGRPILFGVRWGAVDMMPQSGDFDGDGVSDLGVLQRSTAAWYIRTLRRRVLRFGFLWGIPR